MVALQCHDVLHICSGTWLLLAELLTQDQARRFPRISFRDAYLSECPQRCPSDRRNHLAPFRDLQLLLRRHTLLLGRGHRASARFDAPFCRCIWLHQVPLDCARVVVGDARARLASRVSSSFGGNLQMSFVTTHTSMIDVADLSMLRLLRHHPGCETSCGNGCGTRCKRQGPCPQTAICAAGEHSTLEILGTQSHALMKEGVGKTEAMAEARIAGQEAVNIWMAS